MGSAIGDILPLAIGVAVSPVPIIAVILMLFSQRAKINGPMFLLGWVAGLAGLGAITLALSNSSGASDDSSPATGISIVKLLLGVALVLLAVRQWRNRPASGEHVAPPKWMATIDDFTPGKALGMGVVLSAVNPKNLLLTVGAATTIAGVGLSAGGAAVSLGVFVLVGSITIAGPVLLALFGGKSVRDMLDEWKTWLGANNATVMSVLLLVIGMALAGKGIGGLSQG